MTRKLTLALLEDAGACEAQRDIFKVLDIENQLFTEELCRRYAKLFSITWASDNLLTRAARDIYWRIGEKIIVKYRNLEAVRDRADADNRFTAIRADYAAAFYHAWTSDENQIGDPLYKCEGSLRNPNTEFPFSPTGRTPQPPNMQHLPYRDADRA